MPVRRYPWSAYLGCIRCGAAPKAPCTDRKRFGRECSTIHDGRILAFTPWKQRPGCTRLAQLVVQVMTAQAMRPPDLARLSGTIRSRMYIMLNEKVAPIRLCDAERLLNVLGYTVQFRAVKTEELGDER